MKQELLFIYILSMLDLVMKNIIFGFGLLIGLSLIYLVVALLMITVSSVISGKSLKGGLRTFYVHSGKTLKVIGYILLFLFIGGLLNSIEGSFKETFNSLKTFLFPVGSIIVFLFALLFVLAIVIGTSLFVGDEVIEPIFNKVKGTPSNVSKEGRITLYFTLLSSVIILTYLGYSYWDFIVSFFERTFS